VPAILPNPGVVARREECLTNLSKPVLRGEEMLQLEFCSRAVYQYFSVPAEVYSRCSLQHPKRVDPFRFYYLEFALLFSLAGMGECK
jgi:hypothetical protein